MMQNFYKNLVFEHIEEILKFNAKLDENEVQLNSENASNSFCNGRLSLSNHDITARCMFYEVGKIIEEYFEIELEHSFVYPGVYLPGSCLPNHVDKKCGEYVASLTVYNENFDVWPFYVNDEEILLNPGDLVVYDGKIPHYRNTIPNNGFNISIFMLFVDKNGPYYSSLSEIKSRMPPIYNYNLSEVIIKQ
jgi:hypothetical protein